MLSVIACAYVLSGLDWTTYVWFLLWLAVVLAFYFLWGRKHSVLNLRVQQGRDRRPEEGL